MLLSLPPHRKEGNPPEVRGGKTESYSTRRILGVPAFVFSALPYLTAFLRPIRCPWKTSTCVLLAERVYCLWRFSPS